MSRPFWREPAPFGHTLAQARRGEGRLDHVPGRQVHPVLRGEVEEGEQLGFSPLWMSGLFDPMPFATAVQHGNSGETPSQSLHRAPPGPSLERTPARYAVLVALFNLAVFAVWNFGFTAWGLFPAQDSEEDSSDEGPDAST